MSRMPYRWFEAVCLLLSAVLAAAPVTAQRRVVVDSAAVIVNNKVVTARELASLKELQRRDYEARLKGEELQEALRHLDRTVTEKVIENLLLEIRAEQLGIAVNDKEIDQRVEAILRRDPSVSDIYTEEQLKDLVYKDILRRQVTQREIGSRIRVEEEDIRKACLAGAGEGREVEVGHILVRGQDQAAFTKAQTIRQDLLAGADFEREALAKSEDPSVSVNKGRLGFISRGQFVKEFEDTAFALPPGALSEPVRTPFGWHIIKVFAERRRAQADCENLDPATRQRYWNDLFTQQSEKRMAEFMERMRKTADIRVAGS